MWQFQHDNVWKNYNETTSTFIELNTNINIKMNKYEYIINLENLTQTNIQTVKIRLIQRIDINNW